MSIAKSLLDESSTAVEVSRRAQWALTKLKTMPDDKTKKKVDGWFLSLTEKYEVNYFIKDIQKHVPSAPVEQIYDALDGCVEAVKPSEGRERIKACVLAKLTQSHTTRADKDDRPKHPDRTHA